MIRRTLLLASLLLLGQNLAIESKHNFKNAETDAEESAWNSSKNSAHGACNACNRLALRAYN